MEINDDIHDNHEHASTSLKVLLLIFALVLIATLGYLVWLQNTAPSESGGEITPMAKTSEFAGWQTYADGVAGFSLRYPPDVTLINLDKSGDYDLRNVETEFVLFLRTYNLETMEDELHGYNKKDLTALFNDLKSGQVATAVPRMLIKNTLTFRLLDICDVQFTHRFDVFSPAGDKMVSLIYEIAPGRMTNAILANDGYFTTDQENCGSEKIWGSGRDEQFREDLLAGQTDSFTQKWYKDSNKLIKSFKFSS